MPHMSRDHPRACGENLGCTIHASLDAGSPPRVRGKPAELYNYCKKHRITPARAGKTPFPILACFTRGDHPRACGENLRAPVLKYPSRGSPPRVRGKPLVVGVMIPCSRITPARAGKTYVTRAIMHPQKDHPRACGENIPLS